jgi:hypothetical protein
MSTPYSDASPLIPIPLDPQPAPEQVVKALAAHCVLSPFYKYPALTEIGHAYVEACAVAHLDTWLALGQMCHETDRLRSWWCDRPRRNPAGILVNGVTRSAKQGPDPNDPAAWAFNPVTQRWHRGLSFSAWVPYAVEAHISRLMWYVRAAPLTVEQQALYDRGTGDRGMPERARGSARTPRELGYAHNRRGTGWAWPGFGYGQGIARHANALRELA